MHGEPPIEGGPVLHGDADRAELDEARAWTGWGRSGASTPRDLFDIEALIARQPQAVIVVEGIAAIAVIAAVDAMTAAELSLSIFYLVPVIFLGWFVSRRVGLLAALVSAASWALPGLSHLSGSELFASGWNTAVRLGFYLVVVQLVHLMKLAKVRESALARTDSLTGVANGRSFSDRAEHELAFVRRTGHPLTMAYIDLDRFKHVNDTLGHTEGDRLLRATARAIQSRLRATDMVARLGGDEFGVLLPETARDAAPAALAALSEAVTEVVDGSWDVGCTIGAVTFEMAPESVDFMVRSADELMYRGKRAGRGRIEHAVWPTRHTEHSDPEEFANC